MYFIEISAKFCGFNGETKIVAFSALYNYSIVFSASMLSLQF